MVFNKGKNDLTSSHSGYNVWHSMLRRCYSEVYHKSKPTYIGTVVNDDWLLFSNFHDWFVLNCVNPEYQLDKDLIIHNCKEYSDQTCSLIPGEINSALHIDRNNGFLPGVSFKKSHSKFVSQCSMNINGLRVNKHLCISEDQEECFEKYCKEKEKYLKSLAVKYRDTISDSAYEALMNFSVKERTIEK